MATVELIEGQVFEVEVAPAFNLTVEVGLAGRPGTSGADISPDPDNALEERPNGLYVTPLNPLSSTNW